MGKKRTAKVLYSWFPYSVACLIQPLFHRRIYGSSDGPEDGILVADGSFVKLGTLDGRVVNDGT